MNSRRIYAVLAALSWIGWLAVFAAAIALVAGKVQAHEEALRQGQQAFLIRMRICERLSDPPRPHWRECIARLQSRNSALLAPATPGFDLRSSETGLR
jgi:hypothetical protein